MVSECEWQTVLKGCRGSSRTRCLLAIYMLMPQKRVAAGAKPSETEVASKDIAEAMAVSRPSVHVLLDALQKENLIYKEHYGRIVMTTTGLAKAAWLQKHIRTMIEVISAQLGTTLTESAVLAFQCVEMMSASRLAEIEEACDVDGRGEGVMTC